MTHCRQLASLLHLLRLVETYWRQRRSCARYPNSGCDYLDAYKQGFASLALDSRVNFDSIGLDTGQAGSVSANKISVGLVGNVRRQ